MADDDDNPFAPIKKSAAKKKKDVPVPEPEHLGPLVDVEEKTEKPERPRRPVRDSEPQLFGIRKSEMTSAEETYINDQMEELMERLGKKAQLRPIIAEVVRCDNQMVQVDKQIAECEARYGTRMDKLIPKLKSLNAIHKSYMDRYVKACQTLGIMPKDMQPTEGDEALSDIHVRYKDALDKRRKQKQAVGDLSVETRLLAEQEGLRAERYSVPGVLDKKSRAELIDKSDDDSPHEGLQNGII